MLFKVKTLEKIKSCEINLAFRKWKRPTVKEGGTLKTPAGLLSIDSISATSITQISPNDLKRAGFSTLSDLEHELSQSSGDVIYKIEFHLAGPDPRILLRNFADLSSQDIKKIKAKLERFDRSEKYPGWAHKVLSLIQQKPGKSAAEISKSMDIEKVWLKTSIRKLKEMGLTISLDVGYEISPRGESYLRSGSKE